ncbi:MAG: TetR/AcrR family transcriptional regulator [Halopseudomonas aestusnigri]
MARYKEYNRQDVLENAVALFWQKGYKASSMADIVQSTGLNTASMYKEFGNKDGLFEEALEFYRQNVLSPRVQILIENPNITGIREFLESVVKGAAKKTYKGCLMMNHLAQKHTISPKSFIIISDFFSYIESLLVTAIRNAQANGKIPADKDPVVLASFVMCNVHGLVLYGRYPDSREVVLKLNEVIFNSLVV